MDIQLSKIKGYLNDNPQMKESYNRARKSRKKITTVYDVSTVCNLKCDGCLFFDRDGDYSGSVSSYDATEMEEFFIKERDRGVNYPIFSGAEPALNQKILKIASLVWSTGMVHTNGTIIIEKDVPFRLYVSLWGHKDKTAKWRGEDCYDTVLNNIQGDSRVIVNYTINRDNIDDISLVVEDCAKRKIPITFQVYSPTSDYIDVLTLKDDKKFKFAHSSTSSDNLVMRTEDDVRASAIIKECIKKYPESVLFTTDLTNFLFKYPGIFYNELENGKEVAKNCDVSNNSSHKHYLADMSLETTKQCGHPDIECKTCRAYTSIYTGYFKWKSKSLISDEEIKDYFLAHDVFHRIFY